MTEGKPFDDARRERIEEDLKAEIKERRSKEKESFLLDAAFHTKR